MLIILQSKFLGLSREEHIIILPTVWNFERRASCEPFHAAISVTHQISSIAGLGRESSHDCSDDLVNDRHNTVGIPSLRIKHLCASASNHDS